MQLLFRQTQNQALLSVHSKYMQPLMGNLLGKCILLSEEAPLLHSPHHASPWISHGYKTCAKICPEISTLLPLKHTSSTNITLSEQISLPQIAGPGDSWPLQSSAGDTSPSHPVPLLSLPGRLLLGAAPQGCRLLLLERTRGWRWPRLHLPSSVLQLVGLIWWGRDRTHGLSEEQTFLVRVRGGPRQGARGHSAHHTHYGCTMPKKRCLPHKWSAYV